MAVSKLVENNKVIAEAKNHPTISRDDTFTVVKSFPKSYTIWNIGRRNFNFPCYIPLCSCSADYKVNTETLKALKVESEEIALALIKVAIETGGVTGENFDEVLREVKQSLAK